MEQENENYEFEERAAIREYLAGFPRDVAEMLAHDDVFDRTLDNTLLQNEEKQQKQKINEPIKQVSKTKQQKIQEIQDKRDEVGKQMRIEKNEQKKKEMLTQWFDLTDQIIKLRKDPK